MFSLATHITAVTTSGGGSRCWLGVDVGTQGVRAVLVDGSGAVLGSGRAPLPTDVRDGRRHEQDPHEWWPAFCAATRAAVTGRGDRELRRRRRGDC